MRSVLFLVPLALAQTATVNAAEPYLFGAKVTHEDYVGTKIVSSSGRAAVIDLGYEHGVLKGNRFWVFRQVGNDFQKVNTLEINGVKRKTSFGLGTQKSAVRQGDTVVIAAARLGLWFGSTNKEAARLRRLYVEGDKRGYDTKDRALDSEDLLEQRPSNIRKLKTWTRRLQKNKPKGATYWDTAQLRFHRRLFVSSIFLYDLDRVVGEKDDVSTVYFDVLGDVDRYVINPAAALQSQIKLERQSQDETDHRAETLHEADLLAKRIAKIIRARRRQKF